MNDPSIPADGGCAQCSKPRPTAPKSTLVADLQQMIREDPFCSTACCRAWYAVSDPPIMPAKIEPEAPKTELQRLRDEVGKALLSAARSNGQTR